MRVLSMEEMKAVCGGGRLDTADHDGTSSRSGTHSSHTSDGQVQNSGMGAKIGGAVGGFLGARFGKAACGPVCSAIGSAIGKMQGTVLGHLTEQAFVKGTNVAIDKAVHDTHNAIGQARSRNAFGGHG